MYQMMIIYSGLVELFSKVGRVLWYGLGQG